MYCRNCNYQMDPNAVICVKCGVPAGQGTNFCQNCSSPTNPHATLCANCGVVLAKPVPANAKSKLAAGLLGVFLGGFGVHNFYLGYTGKAIAQIILNFCFGIGSIWGFIEGILILCGNIDKDADGNPLKD